MEWQGEFLSLVFGGAVGCIVAGDGEIGDGMVGWTWDVRYVLVCRDVRHVSRFPLGV